MERKEQTGHICRWMACGIMAAIITLYLLCYVNCLSSNKTMQRCKVFRSTMQNGRNIWRFEWFCLFLCPKFDDYGKEETTTISRDVAFR